MSDTDKWVRRFSVDETVKHRNGFTIYKITSVLFPIESPEVVTVVSVWKRYSDIQKLHKNMKSLHSALYLKGSIPEFTKWSYFKRFDPEVIQDRIKTTKKLLEFLAEHSLLFTSAEFVNFLQTGFPEPERPKDASVINAIRSSLHLPIEDTPPLEYQSSDDDSRSSSAGNTAKPLSISSGIGRPSTIHEITTEINTFKDDVTEFNISEIEIFEAADVEIQSPQKKTSTMNSYDSLSSLNSISSDFYDELKSISLEKPPPRSIQRTVLPDLINFEDKNQPSTSAGKFDDYHTMDKMPNTHSMNASWTLTNDTTSDTVSMTSTNYDFSITSPNGTEDAVKAIAGNPKRSESTQSVYSRSFSTLSSVNLEVKTKTEDSYVFEAGYMLNLGARCEDMGDYHRAFECYKSGIEKMLIGVQGDSDPQRRTIIKEKTNKYLAYAESIYRNHLSGNEESLLQDPKNDWSTSWDLDCCLPVSMLRRPYEDLSLYRVLAVLASSAMLVMHKDDQRCYAMKVIQKIPNNLTEFDEYFVQRANESKQPILPTNVPYMVPLHTYIETTNLVFLVLGYAPGGKLFDYIQNYVQSVPTTPAREVNLENVFTEPQKNKTSFGAKETRHKKTEIADHITMDKVGEDRIENKRLDIDQSDKHEENRNVEIAKPKITAQESRGTELTDKTARSKTLYNADLSDVLDISVNDLVINSQRLLLDVDNALAERPKSSIDVVDRGISHKEDTVVKPLITPENTQKVKIEVEARIPVTVSSPMRCTSREALPPSQVCRWGAELLTAIESLHNTGVICRDLNPRNLLLGERGQLILTYFVGYEGLDVVLAMLDKNTSPHEVNLYIAPELYQNMFLDMDKSDGQNLDYVCDYWSFGAIMYELICGIPLSYHHKGMFTSHTILQFPEGLSLEVESILTQLLAYEPSERLGSGKEGIGEIKLHPYFKQIDWRIIHDSWVTPD